METPFLKEINMADRTLSENPGSILVPSQTNFKDLGWLGCRCMLRVLRNVPKRFQWLSTNVGGSTRSSAQPRPTSLHFGAFVSEIGEEFGELNAPRREQPALLQFQEKTFFSADRLRAWPSHGIRSLAGGILQFLR